MQPGIQMLFAQSSAKARLVAGFEAGLFSVVIHRSAIRALTKGLLLSFNRNWLFPAQLKTPQFVRKKTFRVLQRKLKQKINQSFQKALSSKARLSKILAKILNPVFVYCEKDGRA